MSLIKSQLTSPNINIISLSDEKRGRTLQSNPSKKDDSKTIKSSNKRSSKISANIVKNTIHKPPSQYYSRNSQCRSQTKQMVIVNDDKRTEHHKITSRQHQLLDQLEKQQKMRQEQIRQSNESNGDDNKEEKIKITSRFRKLVSQREGLVKMIEASNADSSMMRKEEKQYGEIANDIKLDTLQSKVEVHIGGSIKKEHIYHNTKEEESILMPSPEIDKKSIGMLNDKDKLKSSEGHKKSLENIQELQSPKERPQERSILNLNSEEEEALEKSVQRVMENSENHGHFSSTRQIQININRPSENIKIENSLSLTISKGETSDLGTKKRKDKITKLVLTRNTVYQKVEAKVKQAQFSQSNKNLEGELETLRKAVRQLRLQKVKASAEKEKFILHSDRYASSVDKRQEKKDRTEKTLISDLNIQTETHRSLSTDKLENNQIYFGRIRKNRTQTKQNISLLKTISKIEEHENNPLINIFKLSTNNQDKVVQSSREDRKKVTSIPQAYESQYKTLDLSKISQQNEESHLNQTPIGQSMTLEYSRQSSPARNNEFCQKLMSKVESNDKKFQKFLIRQHSKSRSNRMKRYNQERPHTAVSPDISFSSNSKQWSQIPFQGTIVKNIVKPIYESSEFLQSHSIERQFVLPKLLFLINSAEKKQYINKSISTKAPQIPYIPKSPSHSTSTEDIMNLILTILPLSDQTYDASNMSGCSLKKFKNCIMFSLPDNLDFRIVWHYTGKLYIGQWDSNNNQKNGEGLEYLRNKYYYKGEFIRGKRYGKGLLVYPNGSFYQGEFIEGAKHGKGKYFDNDEKSYYEGSWKNNKMDGNGYLQLQNSVYDGTFKQNHKDGFGIEFFSNGDKFYGQYSLDKFNGQGKYVWADGSSYIGSFKNGYRHQYGRWVSSGDTPDIYIGNYSKDKKNGFGRYVWKNGCVYEGEFNNDVKHGVGNVQYPDGRYMEGLWTQGILTNVISKLTEAHVEDPLEEPKLRGYQTHTRIIVTEIDHKEEH